MDTHSSNTPFVLVQLLCKAEFPAHSVLACKGSQAQSSDTGAQHDSPHMVETGNVFLNLFKSRGFFVFPFAFLPVLLPCSTVRTQRVPHGFA